jgi:hypothetical protein
MWQKARQTGHLPEPEGFRSEENASNQGPSTNLDASPICPYTSAVPEMDVFLTLGADPA